MSSSWRIRYNGRVNGVIIQPFAHRDETHVERRQSAPRRRMLKAGKILLGKHPISCTIRNISEKGACLVFQTTAGIPAAFDLLMSGESARTRKTIWRDQTQIRAMFILWPHPSLRCRATALLKLS